MERAASVLRGLFPEDHDLAALCRHRAGMVAVALGDQRTAAALLQVSPHL